MEFKVGDRVEFVGGADLAPNHHYLGMRGIVEDVAVSDAVRLLVRFNNNHLARWYSSSRWKLVKAVEAAGVEVQIAHNTTTVVEACAEVKKISDIVTSLQQDLQEISNLSPGYVSIGVGSSHFRLGNLSENHDSELRKLLIASREKNLADAEQLLKEKIEELSRVLTNAG